MQGTERHDRSSGIGAAATHAGLRGDALDEREARASRQAEPRGDKSGGAQDEIAGVRAHDALGLDIMPAMDRRALMTHSQRETAHAALRDQRVGERHRLEHRDEIVESIVAPRADRQSQVELGVG